MSKVILGYPKDGISAFDSQRADFGLACRPESVNDVIAFVQALYDATEGDITFHSSDERVLKKLRANPLLVERTK